MVILALLVGGNANNGAQSGLLTANVHNVPTNANANIGSGMLDNVTQIALSGMVFGAMQK